MIDRKKLKSTKVIGLSGLGRLGKMVTKSIKGIVSKPLMDKRGGRSRGRRGGR